MPQGVDHLNTAHRKVSDENRQWVNRNSRKKNLACNSFAEKSEIIREVEWQIRWRTIKTTRKQRERREILELNQCLPDSRVPTFNDSGIAWGKPKINFPNSKGVWIRHHPQLNPQYHYGLFLFHGFRSLPCT